MSTYHRGSLLATLLTVLACACGALGADSPRPRLEARVVEAVSGRRILPDDRHPPAAVASEIRVRVCPGEYEPASFVLVASGGSFANVRPKPTALYSSGGVVPAESVDIKIVDAWYQSGTAWRHHRQPERRSPVLVPELLVNDAGIVRPDPSRGRNLLKLRFPGGDRYVPESEFEASRGRLAPSVRRFPLRDSNELIPVRIPSGAQRQYWVTVHAPAGQPAGVYRGSVRIESGRRLLVEIPILVEVLPFSLADAGLTYSVYYRAKLDPDHPTVSSEGKSAEQLRAELADMIRHGVTNPTIYQPWPKPKDPPGVRLAKIERVREVLRIRQKLGMDGQPIYYLGRHAESGTGAPELARLGADVREIRGLAARFNVPEVYFYGADEARGARLRGQAVSWRRVHAEGGKVFAAGYVGHTREAGGLTDLLVLHGPPNRDEAEQQHRHGNRIFSYANPQSGTENPVPFRKNYGARLWQAGFDGAMIYAYQDSMGSIWNDFDHDKWRDHALTYPTTRSPIATLAWEGLREGIDDVRYIRTLERAVRRAPESPEAVEAARFLAALRRQEDFDPALIRATVIQHLTRMAATAVGGPTS